MELKRLSQKIITLFIIIQQRKKYDELIKKINFERGEREREEPKFEPKPKYCFSYFKWMGNFEWNGI